MMNKEDEVGLTDAEIAAHGMQRHPKDQNVLIGSGNVFRDLGHPNPELKLKKAKLVYNINERIEQCHLTKKQVRQILNLSESHRKRLRSGDFAFFNLKQLQEFLHQIERNT